MDHILSGRVAMALIGARSCEQVQEVCESDGAREWFSDSQHWAAYGNRQKNWDTVGNQQASPVGALVEVITNGIDAILLRKCREAGIPDFRSPAAPKSMHEAVKRFFPEVLEGKIVRMEPGDRSRLAKQCVRVGVARANRRNYTYPTYTIVDSGDGQLPADFPKTFLSLSEKNKEGIAFVQGKFNMGSTGSLRFCTRSDMRLGHYKLIVSRPPKQTMWGWTLVRVRAPRGGEALPVTEFFSPYGRNIPTFSAPQIEAFGQQDIGIMVEGSLIKLFEYDIGPNARTIDFGLAQALTVNLLDCALPIQLYDFDAQPVEGKGDLRRRGIAERTFAGLNAVLRAEFADSNSATVAPSEHKTEWVHQVEDVQDENLGRFQIVATAVQEMQSFLKDQPGRIFYTINGQAHAFERASFLNGRCGLPDLRNHLLVTVICDTLTPTALAMIFMPDRERKANNDLARILEKRVVDALKGDERIRGYAAEIRRRRANSVVEDSAATTDLLKEMIKSDPTIRELFGLGAVLPEITQVSGGQTPFVGTRFPTFLRPLNLRQEDGVFVKELPLGSIRRIECGTDAEDAYLTRNDSPGEVFASVGPDVLQYSAKLHNGIARFAIQAPEGVITGNTVTATFGFTDSGRNIRPLGFTVSVRFVEPEPVEHNPTGTKRSAKDKPQEALAEPEFAWVSEDGWSEHGFDLDAGAYVATGDATVVYVNRDNKYLRSMRVKERDEGARILNENLFRLGLGLIALAVQRRFVADAERESQSEDLTRLATAGIAPYIVTIIRRLGGTDALT